MENHMSMFEVGKPYLPVLGLGEGVRFSIGPNGALLTYEFDDPTPKEIEATKSGQAFEIRFVTLGGIIWVLSKCGTLAWTDAPYNPRLSGDLLDTASFVDGAGLGMTLVMLDSRDAMVKSVRFIGLGTEFSRRLLEEAINVKRQPMTMMQAEMSIQRTMQSYPTSQLVKMAPAWARFKL